MGFSQNDWIAFWVIGTITGLPYILEYVRMNWILLPGDYYKRNRKNNVQWYNRTTWSVEWYTTMRNRIRTAPPLWAIPIAWLCLWFFGTTATLLVWQNKENYADNTWNTFLGIQTTLNILTIVWNSNALRSTRYVYCAMLSLIIALLVITNIALSMYGSFHKNFEPDGVIYAIYGAIWLYFAILSISFAIIEKQGAFDLISFRPLFLYVTGPDYDVFPPKESFLVVNGETTSMRNYVPDYDS